MIPKEMTRQEKHEALESLMFLKKKRCGRIKGRTCADGRPQQKCIPKEDAASPTVSLEGVLLTAVVDAEEGRDIAVVDIPNAFVQTKNVDKVIMKMRGKLAELMVLMAPEIYRKAIILEHGKPVLYVRLLGALYGQLKAALLWYKKLVSDLEEKGFVINPYDACVANKMINGKQMTQTWHVDDIKISHVDPEEVTLMMDWLKTKYEDLELGEMKASRGKIHEYLGMTLDYTTPGKVKVKMIDYVKQMVIDFGDELVSIATTPALDHLFTMREDALPLDVLKSQKFHTFTAKGLFLCKRARPDIQTAIAFLSTRVSKPDQDDWTKLTRMMRYLKGTEELFLTLSSDCTNVLEWHVDVSYAVHQDCKSHTGGNFSMGEGTISGKSTKQKLNTKSSTEAELVGSDDVMPQLVWTNYFLDAQGYDVKETIMYQDNKSAILMKKNGKFSSSKRTKHINVRYFFIKDRIQNGELKVEYCPTDNMIADFFTKPLQGSKFLQFRKIILNL